jgi:hypothetical protein
VDERIVSTAPVLPSLDLPPCACGCGRPVNTKGRQFLKGHHSRRPLRYEVDSETGCWNWTGHLSQGKYGSFRRDGKEWYAHRWFWVQRNGEVPDGCELHHTCENKRCCNPDHLKAVTPVEHTRYHHSAEYCDRGHLREVLPNGKRQCRECRLERRRRWYAENKERLKRG